MTVHTCRSSSSGEIMEEKNQSALKITALLPSDSAHNPLVGLWLLLLRGWMQLVSDSSVSNSVIAEIGTVAWNEI